jgi:hypothetical protein
VEALCQRGFGMDCRIKSGNDERKKENIGGETPTDAMEDLPGLTDPAAPQT